MNPHVRASGILLELAGDLMAEGGTPADVDAAARLLVRAADEARKGASWARANAPPPEPDPPF